jgi:membrane fusion protein, copper/silver efflux system
VNNNILALIALALLALAALPAAADDTQVMMPMDGKVVSENYMGTGRVDNVDVKAGKISLSHETIPGLEQMPKNMSYDVLNSELLANLKQGQNVEFKLIEVRKGRYMISDIRVAK